MTIRERLNEITATAKTQVDLDRIWHNGLPRQIKSEFPNMDPGEFFYEWDNIKNRIKKMV